MKVVTKRHFKSKQSPTHTCCKTLMLWISIMLGAPTNIRHTCQVALLDLEAWIACLWQMKVVTKRHFKSKQSIQRQPTFAIHAVKLWCSSESVHQLLWISIRLGAPTNIRHTCQVALLVLEAWIACLWQNEGRDEETFQVQAKPNPYML